MSAPVGNSNAKKGKAWSEAVKRAIRAKYGTEWEEALQTLALELVNQAAAGDMTALKEIGDRIDGKPKQTIGGDEDTPLEMRIGWKTSST